VSPDQGSDDATSATDANGRPEAQHEPADQFIARTISEGASPEAAKMAADGHFEFEAKRLPPGKLLQGWTARRWQQVMFIMLGGFLAVLISVLFTAPAFHPTESETQANLWVTLFAATFFPILVLMFGSAFAMLAREAKEIRNDYTTLRWLGRTPTQVLDSHGNPIRPGDKRLNASAKYMHAFIFIGSACAVVSPIIWILRLVIR
jgi:hypothetical protein